jgi:hypothetical protein
VNYMRNGVLFLFLLLGGLTGLCQKPADPPKQEPFKIPDVVKPKEPYTSDHGKLLYTEEQNLQLQSKLLADNYQQQLTQLQNQYANLEENKKIWESKVKADNGWDDSYQYDWDKDQWTHTVKEASNKSETKPITKK